jgi:hypothetical protein
MKVHSERRKERNMMTQRNMKTRRSLSGRIVLSLLIGIIGGLVWSGTSAQAFTAESILGGGAGYGGGGGQTTAIAASVVSTLQIPVAGTFIEPDGTILSISGYVTVNCTMVTDATLAAPPAVVLTLDFSNVTASDGLLATGVLKTGGFQDIKIRLLQASDTIPITCPYFLNKLGLSSADTWLVTTTLNFDVSTGKLTSGSATVGNNPYLVLAF